MSLHRHERWIVWFNRVHRTAETPCAATFHRMSETGPQGCIRKSKVNAHFKGYCYCSAHSTSVMKSSFMWSHAVSPGSSPLKAAFFSSFKRPKQKICPLWPKLLPWDQSNDIFPVVLHWPAGNSQCNYTLDTRLAPSPPMTTASV